MVATGVMTVEEFAQLHSDYWRYELIRGEVLRMPPAGGRHGLIAGEVAIRVGHALLTSGAGKTFLADTGFLLARDPDVLLAPDAAFIRADRLSKDVVKIGYLEIAPDIVLEVLSPNDRASDVMAKVSEYLRAGAQILWLVDPDRKTITVYRPGMQPEELSGSDELDGGEIIPELRIPLAEIFEPLPAD